MSAEVVRTRFPPEPNGYLHMGHVKAMLFDFLYHPDCDCTLRLDDTNPEAEKQEYVDAILEDVKWMGFTPSRVTYTSDYFDILYNYAEEFMKRNKAYVDFSSAEEIKEGRRNGTESDYRNKSVEWNLEHFHKMRDGVFDEGACVLRLKINMTDENPNLRDPIAYRIKKTPHYRTGTKWCIYPSYDYSHGIVDALESITHSYCTSEFYIRRPQYLWPVLELGLTPATVLEFGRLNVEGVMLSKRKIIPLVENRTLDGFDDPRLYTIRGLRRRGFTPSILKELAGLSSIERKDTELSQDIVLHTLRSSLASAPKSFAIIDPLKMNIVNTNRIVYFEKTDFREVDSPDYYRLAPGKIIRLKYDNFITYVSHSSDEILTTEAETNPGKKVKGIIHWVSNDAIPVLFYLYDGMNICVKRGFVKKDVEIKEGTVYQFERLGFFRCDKETSEQGLPVFLRIVGLVNKFD